jgi:hypothetical protein
MLGGIRRLPVSFKTAVDFGEAQNFRQCLEYLA